VKYLILSDIHSNAEALAAVLARVRRKKYDRVVVLGDLVGYGASPNPVVERVRRLRRPTTVIRGNHDRVVTGGAGGLFNPVALEAAFWTAHKLTTENRRYLEGLPPGPAVIDGAFAICHGSPRDEDAYIFSDYDAWLNFPEFEPDVCFFGHSHIPCVFTLEEPGIKVELVRNAGARWKLEPGRRYLINPGSIGQPRDRNPAASYALYDSTARVVAFDRVAYDASRACARIKKAGLPGVLGDRLLEGI
jgi:predicted phosphodiesterase